MIIAANVLGSQDNSSIDIDPSEESVPDGVVV
jgi:hypothetical protein